VAPTTFNPKNNHLTCRKKKKEISIKALDYSPFKEKCKNFHHKTKTKQFSNKQRDLNIFKSFGPFLDTIDCFIFSQEREGKPVDKFITHSLEAVNLKKNKRKTMAL